MSDHSMSLPCSIVLLGQVKHKAGYIFINFTITYPLANYVCTNLIIKIDIM